MNKNQVSDIILPNYIMAKYKKRNFEKENNSRMYTFL